jgi:hypothetical protein
MGSSMTAGNFQFFCVSRRRLLKSDQRIGDGDSKIYVIVRFTYNFFFPFSYIFCRFNHLWVFSQTFSFTVFRDFSSPFMSNFLRHRFFPHIVPYIYCECLKNKIVFDFWLAASIDSLTHCFFHVGEVSIRFDNSGLDSLDNWCYRSSRLCWMQNSILNRMVLFSERVIGQKIGFYLENWFFT